MRSTLRISSWIFGGILLTFLGLYDRKVYLDGESYAGQYVPYVASQMLDAEDERYFKVSGVQINDPWVNDEDVTMNAPAAEAMNYFQSVFALNDSFMADINKHANDCGYKRISPRWHLHTLP